MGEGGALPFSLPSFPFSPETPDTQAIRASTTELTLRALTPSHLLQLSSLDVTGDQSGQTKMTLHVSIFYFQ